MAKSAKIARRAGRSRVAGRRRGTLRGVGITKKTHDRYYTRLRHFFGFIALFGIPTPKTLDALDRAVSDYIDHLWQEYEPEG